MKRFSVLGLALLLALAPGAFAQIGSGNIYGTVKDESGAVLPGANVTLSGDLGTRSTTSGPQGEFRFLNLDRGRYKMTVSLTGFTSVARELQVTTGESLTVDYGLKVAQVAETVTVTADTPLVDTKKRGTATTMSTEELQNVPNARDPWGVLKNVPGVLLDRVNIAGNENGQQASVAGKGSDTTDKMFTLDGINITDMSATGASPTYFDFEAFQEINVATGGSDLQVQSGGIGINMVTKRGTNTFHGSARYLIADEDWSTSNIPDELAGDARLQGGEFADHIEKLQDWGFDLGGPIIKDKVWFYGTFGRQDIELERLNQTPDDTILDSYNAKLNWQAASQTMVSAFYFVGKKKKFGRSVGYPGETDDFLWNQDNAYVEGGVPGGLWKLQADHTFSPNFFMSAKAAYYDTGFGLFPRGGPDQNFTVDYVAGESIGSYYTYQAIRPQKSINLDGSYFFTGMGGNNEFKFGFGYRDLKTNSLSVYSGDKLAGWVNGGPDENFAWIARDGITEYGGKYVSAYIGDVFTKNRLSVNVGARWDLQTAKNLPSEAGANPAFGSLLPALSFSGNDEDVISWNDISPRLGMSYALDEQRKTVLRASFARYADQLSFGDVAGATGENPVGSSILAYGWVDRNGDRLPQANEINLNDFRYSTNVDPDNPAAVGTTTNKVDRDLKAKHDTEFILGLDREVASNFAVGAAFTYRRGTDWQWRPRLAGPCTGEPTRATCPIITASQYTPLAPATGGGFTVNRFAPPAALVSAGAGGRIRTNRDGYYTNFMGVELTATKRLANKWMGRLAVSFNDWTEHWEDGVTPTSFLGNPTRVETDALVDGGQVALLSGGSGKASFYSSVKWQVYANTLVQLPWQLDLSAALFAKQGGSFPTSVRAAAGSDGTLSILATPEVDTNRYDDVFNFDLRLAKNIKIQRAAVTLSVEAFNLFNNDVVLSRFRYTGPTLGRVEEIIAPRTIRLGARLGF